MESGKPGMSAPADAHAAGALANLPRLLGYLRPHRGMFLLGVLGTAMFAASMRLRGVRQEFLDGTFVERDPRMVMWCRCR